MAADTPQIFALIKEMRDRSKYAFLEMDEKFTKSLVVNSVQRHGAPNVGGMCLFVSERDGVVDGFILGVLDRFYHIGVKLMATDVFFYVAEAGYPRHAGALFSRYLKWVQGNPRVISVRSGATDAIGNWKRTAKLYQRHGFHQIGGLFEKVIVR